MADAAIGIAPNVYRIPTTPFDLVNSYAFVADDGSVTLVDTGLKGAPPKILNGIAALGKHPEDVTRIVLTHAHADHAGGAADLAERTGTQPDVHTDDASWVRRGKVPPQGEAGFLARGMIRSSNTFPAVEVGHELTDGEVLDAAGGLRVVHTPGHSPGHVSLLHEPSGVLITGDAIFNVRGLRWPVKAFCSDFALTRRTAQRLADLDYDVAAFTHGPHVSQDAREKVRGFLRDASR